MESIAFEGIPRENFDLMRGTFLLVKRGKECGRIDEELVRIAMGRNAQKFVSDPALVEALLEQWRKDRAISVPWEFGSWIDALTNCELRFHRLGLGDDGRGTLVFELLAWPSGGLDATEELVRVFGGRIVSNSAASMDAAG